MTTGEFDYSDILVSSAGQVNPKSGAPLIPYESLSRVFFFIFVLAMTLVLSNLLVSSSGKLIIKWLDRSVRLP